MNYPQKPWRNGQKFVDNGTVYEYDATTNSWNFSKLTYNRLCGMLQFAVPKSNVTFYIEFSEDPMFSNIVLSYNSGNTSHRTAMFAFYNGFFNEMTSSVINGENVDRLVLVPSLDKNFRYYGRFRWTYDNGSQSKWFPITVSGGDVSTDISLPAAEQPAVMSMFSMRSLPSGENQEQEQERECFEDAPEDGKLYGRKNGEWIEVSIPDVKSKIDTHNSSEEAHKQLFESKSPSNHQHSNYLKDAPDDGKKYVRGNGTWIEMIDTRPETMTWNINNSQEVIIDANVCSRHIIEGDGNCEITFENLTDGDSGQIVIDTSLTEPLFPLEIDITNIGSAFSDPGLYVIEFFCVLNIIVLRIKFKVR